MLDPPSEFREVAEGYVCARVIDVQSLDLTRFRFDYDLTLAALLMHPDGSIYHRFGGRDADSATRWSSVAALTNVMRATLPEHRAYVPIEPTDAEEPALVVWDLPAFAARVDAKKVECIHCHSLNEAEHQQAVADGDYDRERAPYLWPAPERVGLTLDPLDQALLTAVAPDSPASKAGLRAGDRLARAGEQRLLTYHDLQFVLHEAPWGPTEFALVVRRGEEELHASLALPEGWKRVDSRDYAWRPYKWHLGPKPGFGGPALTPDEKRALGLQADDFAYRVTYLVTWGHSRATGQAAARAGIRQGDVVLALDDKRDFASPDHAHAWFRLTREPGATCAIEVLRAGKRLTIELPVGARE